MANLPLNFEQYNASSSRKFMRNLRQAGYSGSHALLESVYRELNHIPYNEKQAEKRTLKYDYIYHNGIRLRNNTIQDEDLIPTYQKQIEDNKLHLEKMKIVIKKRKNKEHKKENMTDFYFPYYIQGCFWYGEEFYFFTYGIFSLRELKNKVIEIQNKKSNLRGFTQSYVFSMYSLNDNKFLDVGDLI